MKFSEYRTHYDAFKKELFGRHYAIQNQDGSLRKIGWNDFYLLRISKEAEIKCEFGLSYLGVLLAEHYWYEQCRPYYKIWPKITPALLRISLDANCCRMNIEDRTLLIRFPEKEPLLFGQGNNYRLRSILCSVNHSEKKHQLIQLIAVVNLPSESTDEMMGLPPARLIDDRTIAQFIELFCLGYSHDKAQVPKGFPANEFATLCLKVAFTVLLLANDPEIISPDVLSKDREKYEQEKDEDKKKVIVDRSRRKGIVGWNVGLKQESCPHYRMPHFGIRYTGKNGSIPRIVPIKGSIVHRSKLTEVPTGYILPDGREMEPHGNH